MEFYFSKFFLTYCNQISLVGSGVPAFLILAHADITQKTAGSYYAWVMYTNMITSDLENILYLKDD